MRLIGLIVGGTLAVAVVAEGAYIVHTRRQVERLANRLEAIGAEESDLLAGLDSGRGASRGSSDEDAPGPRRGGGTRLPPPRLVPAPAGATAPSAPSDDPLPLPPAVDTAEGREQLRRFVVAQMEREREEGRLRQEQRQSEREQARRQRMAQDLGLSPPETETFNQILSQVQTSRATLRSRIESGELSRESFGREVAAMREETERQMRGLLGEDRMKKFGEMRGAMPGPMGGDRMQGDRRRGGWGGPPGRGSAPPASATAPAP